jgi:hypothetical protein
MPETGPVNLPLDGTADAWRIWTAAASVAVLFLLVVGIVAHGHTLTLSWRAFLWAMVGHTAVIAYLETSRARSTPPGYPERVDLPLVGLGISLAALLATIVVVNLKERRPPE